MSGPADAEGRFAAAREAALASRGSCGIGTLGERTLHACLKYYLAPNDSTHEARMGRYVADIADERGVIEIQTGSFQRLRDKLRDFLTCWDVTLVYPVAQVKWLVWVSPETGETTKRRRSPKTGTPADAFFELYKIRPLLTHPRLRLWLPLLEVEEFRLLSGWSADGKRGSTRCERVPLSLLGSVAVERPGDYARLLPPSLPEPFDSKELSAAARLSRPAAQTALTVLFHVGAVERVGKRGNAYLYRRSSSSSSS